MSGSDMDKDKIAQALADEFSDAPIPDEPKVLTFKIDGIPIKRNPTLVLGDGYHLINGRIKNEGYQYYDTSNIFSRSGFRSKNEKWCRSLV